MNVFVAGASGALGIPLIHRLLDAGHEVIGLTRSGFGAEALSALGATPVVADALDRDALLRAVDGLAADAIVHELTALKSPPRRHAGMVPTDRLREEGTANLLAAADVLGAKRFVTQSIVFGYGFGDHGPQVLDEAAPFGRPHGDANDPHLAAMLATEQQAFTAPEGVALRYGLLYGGDAEAMRTVLGRRGVPVARGGLLAWVHHDDAADATVAALDRGQAGEAYNVVDDEPAAWRDVYTAMAAALGTPAPRRVPRWAFRLAAPYVATFALDTTMRVSNAKAAAELGWRPRFPTYRDGVAAMAG
ncbi:MAG TPA: NAD(P)-dependent oxidoreductase [Acidimicrobiales bacterium]|nr:NAD(P)-dependent oxidoreductase [Acidimicrobiales bacterium]